jgi:hypothetical protein
MYIGSLEIVCSKMNLFWCPAGAVTIQCQQQPEHQRNWRLRQICVEKTAAGRDGAGQVGHAERPHDGSRGSASVELLHGASHGCRGVDALRQQPSEVPGPRAENFWTNPASRCLRQLALYQCAIGDGYHAEALHCSPNHLLGTSSLEPSH